MAGIEVVQLQCSELLLFTFPNITNIRGVRRVQQWGLTLYVSTYTGENTGFVKSDWPQLPCRLAWAQGFEVAFSSGACFASADTVKTDDMPNKMATLQLHYWVKWIWFLSVGVLSLRVWFTSWYVLFFVQCSDQKHSGCITHNIEWHCVIFTNVVLLDLSKC